MPTRKKRKSEETALSKAIQQALTAKGCKVIRIQSGILPVKRGEVTHFVHCAPAGTPDLLVIRPPTSVHPMPRYVHIEVKKTTGASTKEQLAWASWAAINNVRCATVRTISEALKAVF